MGEFKPIEIEKILENVKRDLHSKLVAAKAHIEITPLNHNIIGDEVLIYQLFQNLISNAIKYSRSDVQTKISIKHTMQDDYLMITVKDNGIGIEDSTQDIFNLFTRSNNASTKEGYGIGLATCKEVMEIHSGKIDYKSELGVGTSFNLYFKTFRPKE